VNEKIVNLAGKSIACTGRAVEEHAFRLPATPQGVGVQRDRERFLSLELEGGPQVGMPLVRTAQFGNAGIENRGDAAGVREPMRFADKPPDGERQLAHVWRDDWAGKRPSHSVSEQPSVAQPLPVRASDFRIPLRRALAASSLACFTAARWAASRRDRGRATFRALCPIERPFRPAALSGPRPNLPRHPPIRLHPRNEFIPRTREIFRRLACRKGNRQSWLSSLKLIGSLTMKVNESVELYAWHLTRSSFRCLTAQRLPLH
jgi:hypothetical protein